MTNSAQAGQGERVRPNAWYGYRRDARDPRDHLFTPKGASFPDKVDLREYCPPVMDQGELGSCHDDQTDVLTDRGWMRFANLTGGERLASVNPATAELHFERPVRLIRMPYVGKLVCARNRSLDFRVTPDHMMVVRKWNEATRTLENEYTQVPAKGMGWYSGLLNRVRWAGESPSATFTLPGVEHKHLPQRVPQEVSMAAWLRFLGIYLAEGTMLKERRSIGPGRPGGGLAYKIQIAASKPREKDFVRSTLADIGVMALELSDRFTLSNKRLFDAMCGLGLFGVKASQKRVPEFVFWQDECSIREFLLGHFMGDGSEQDGLRCHYTSSVGLADDLHRLIFMSGNETVISVREARSSMTADGRSIVGRFPEYRVSVRQRKNLSIERREAIFEEDYDGEVFCAEVPTFHTLITRRNGKILISGNCTAHGTTAALRYNLLKAGKPDVPLSRLQLYYDSRKAEGTIYSDSGAEIRDVIKCAGKIGVGHETLWPYKIAKFKVHPPDKCYADAVNFNALEYQRVAVDATHVKAALHAGNPVIIGITVFKSFDSPEVEKTGVVPMPGQHDVPDGGHCMLVVGHGQKPGYFTVRNSWASDWGDKGDCYLPEAYVGSTKFGGDYWIVRGVG